MGKLLYGVNVVTVIIVLILALSVFKGLSNDFSHGTIFGTIYNTINDILFVISLAASVYFTKKLFMEEYREGIYNRIYGFLPENITSYLADAGILVYVIVTPLLLFLIFSLLTYIRSYFDCIIIKTSKMWSTKLTKLPKIVRRLLGLLIEVPKALFVVIIIVSILSYMSAYYPVNTVSQYAQDSKAYRYVYGKVVSPLFATQFGQKVPVFLQDSFEEISEGIEDSKVLGDSEGLKNIGLIRFKYESRSNEEIDAMAKKIVGKETDEKKKAYLLYKWIGGNIEYDWDKYNNIINNTPGKDKFGAIEAFNTRKGVCEDYSDLYAAMARAVGLKVRIIVGQGYSMGNWGGHAWNEVYISGEQRWIPLDTTWARAGNYFDKKDFNKDHVFEAVAAEW